jgi:hypothetical protein
MHANDTRDSDKRRATRKRGGTRVSVDELVDKSHTVFDRVVPYLERAAERIRHRFTRK